jgi:hypothetical protein
MGKNLFFQMTRNFIFSLLTALLFFMAATSFCYANDGHPKSFPHIVSYKELIPLQNDTIPATKKIPETKTDNSSTGTTIKEVPKAKKQIAPVAVPVQVKLKPIKIIKPKIIKPVIKIN